MATRNAAAAVKAPVAPVVADNDGEGKTINTLKTEALALIAEGKANPFKEFSTGDKKVINPYLLHIKEGWNIRFESDINRKSIVELAESIAAVGVKNPLVVNLDKEHNRYWVEDGHRRYRATLYAIEVLGAEIRGVPIILGERGADEATRVFSQFVRNSGKDLEPIEVAALFQRMLSFGWTEEDIYVKSGYGRQRFQQLLDLVDLDEKLKKFIINGTASELLVTKTLEANNNSVEVTLKTLEAAVEDKKDTIELKTGVRPETVKVLPKDVDKAVENGKAPATAVAPRAPRSRASAATQTAPKASETGSTEAQPADGKMTDSEFGKWAKMFFKKVGIDVYERDGSDVEGSFKIPEAEWLKVVKHCDL